MAIFQQFTGTVGAEVLYAGMASLVIFTMFKKGDNIYHDIISSKKNRCLWRTLLVVRELETEMQHWQQNKPSYDYLQNLEYLRAKTYQSLTSEHVQAPNASDLKSYIKIAGDKMNSNFNKWFGSVFRSGSSESYFSYQVMRYCDLYASDYCHLLYYPFFYYFFAQVKFLPHEKQVLNELDETSDE